FRCCGQAADTADAHGYLKAGALKPLHFRVERRFETDAPDFKRAQRVQSLSEFTLKLAEKPSRVIAPPIERDLCRRQQLCPIIVEFAPQTGALGIRAPEQPPRQATH